LAAHFAIWVLNAPQESASAAFEESTHTQPCGSRTSLFARWSKVATVGCFDVKEQILSLFGRQVDEKVSTCEAHRVRDMT
jgi:hypothetical protein